MNDETKDLLYRVYIDSLKNAKLRWDYLTLPPDERMRLSQEYYQEFFTAQGES